MGLSMKALGSDGRSGVENGERMNPRYITMKLLSQEYPQSVPHSKNPSTAF